MDHLAHRTLSSLRPAMLLRERVFSAPQQSSAGSKYATFFYVNNAAPLDKESMWPSAIAKP